MLRSYLAAALRNLARNRAYAAISIVGLAVGMAAAILTGLYVRDELTFDHAIPGHENVYEIVTDLDMPGRALVMAVAPDQFASWLKLDFPRIAALARLTASNPRAGPASLRRGDFEGLEQIAWADPDFFQVVPMPLVAGDLKTALARPDGVVLTRSMARKYFGRDAPIGGVLQLNRRQPFRVAAVIEDRPGATSIPSGIFLSALAPGSPHADADAQPYRLGDLALRGRTLLRLDPAMAATLGSELQRFADRRMHLSDPGVWPPTAKLAFRLVRLDRMHLYPVSSGIGRGSLPLIWGLTGMALLTLAVAAINFVNMTTARAGRRAVEVAVRKASGAGRGSLMAQMLGETLIYAVLAMLLAVALVELALPWLNALLLRTIDFAYWRDPVLLAAIVGLTVGMGLVAGLYPALVMTAFRPAVALRGQGGGDAGSPAVRAGLVVAQFAILIALIVSAVVVYSQIRFLLDDGLRVRHEQVLTVVSPCRPNFVEPVRALQGVGGAVCSSLNALNRAERNYPVVLRDGTRVLANIQDVDFEFFDFYGVKPIAGRLFLRNHPADALPPSTPGPPQSLPSPKTVVINETAVRQLRLGSAAKASGSRVQFGVGQGATFVDVIGVVPDFAFDTSQGPIVPTAYFVDPGLFNVISIRLVGDRIPETLAAIDALWKRVGEPRPIQRRFVDDYLQEVYVTTIRQGWLVGALTAVAVLVAILGLFGLAAFTAERRTKEIGVRKALGASRTDILRLLLWRFSKPVLWANLIAWPLGWWIMDRWLHGFAYRVPLGPGPFLLAGLAALLIAWATTLAHALKVARAAPVLALRYE